MTDLVTLRFVNRDAAMDADVEMQVDRRSAPLIAKWYGAYCGGDDYDVLIDGETVEKDINGEIGG